MSSKHILVLAFCSLSALARVALVTADAYFERAVCQIGNSLAVAFRYILSSVPASSLQIVIARFKAIDFALIKRLKPVYRNSYDTHGLSLTVT